MPKMATARLSGLRGGKCAAENGNSCLRPDLIWGLVAEMLPKMAIPAPAGLGLSVRVAVFGLVLVLYVEG